MERPANLLRQFDFQVLWFFLGLMLLNWPIVDMSWLEQPRSAYIWLFLVWAYLIFVLFLIGRSSIRNNPPLQQGNEPCSTRQ
ncbi:MAG: hypothetical protein P4L55_23370 [Syntrophobacteraceae bacterium]|nr:hypothetical protein [Syntrophobacteraceae bacterium]